MNIACNSDLCFGVQTLHRLFVVNANSGFRMLWLALKTFLDARTLAKVQVRIFPLVFSWFRHKDNKCFFLYRC